VTLDFEELKFGLAGGDYVYDSHALDRFLTERGLDPEDIFEREEIFSVILGWYLEHRIQGGAENRLIEDLAQEAQLSRGRTLPHVGHA
jgi:hypothetical protein